MRELTVRIRFTSPSLGNVRKEGPPCDKFMLPRAPNGRITYLAAWHYANLTLAAQLLNRHHTVVKEILWDIFIDGLPPRGERQWHRRWFTNSSNKKRYAEHECFPAGHIIGINCAVPSAITDDDMLQLMGAAGRYKGLSPWSPNEYGHFEVVSIRPRRSQPRPGPPKEKANSVLDKQKT